MKFGDMKGIEGAVQQGWLGECAGMTRKALGDGAGGRSKPLSFVLFLKAFNDLSSLDLHIPQSTLLLGDWSQTYTQIPGMSK